MTKTAHYCSVAMNLAPASQQCMGSNGCSVPSGAAKPAPESPVVSSVQLFTTSAYQCQKLSNLSNIGQIANPRDEKVWSESQWETEMLRTVVAVLLILWLLGFYLHIGGALIHVLLVAGLVVLVINLVSGRRTAR
jgi:hypothetical protein